MMVLLKRGLFLAPALALSGLAVDAQTVYGVNGAPAPPRVEEITGPPAGPCGYPTGPIVASFPTTVPPACPALGAFGFPLGDIAGDPLSDFVYVTDGPTIGVFTAGGAFFNSFPAPYPLTGMGVDALGPLLWITDGATYGAIVPPPPPCAGAPPPWAIGPFPIPMGGPFFGGMVTDLTWDSASGSLMGCDVQGNVVSFLPGPAPALGPYGFYNAVGGPCGLGPNLTGIVMDKALPGSGIHYVTDGVMIAYWLPPPPAGGSPAPLTFYTSLNCIPVPTPPYDGLSYSGHGIRYGNGGDTMGRPAPSISTAGQFAIGNNNVAILATGSVPNSLAVLRFNPASRCPPLFFKGLPINIQAPYFKLLPRVNVDAAGTATLPVAIPPATPAALTFYLQWVILTPNSLQLTEGMEVTTILP